MVGAEEYSDITCEDANLNNKERGRMIVDKEKSLEIFEYLKSKMEIPENVVTIDIRFNVDGLTTIVCAYYPESKEKNGKDNS